jgi:multidrug efflux pump subunit AcrB
VLTAEFKPFQSIDVMAKVAGYVKSINVDVGSRVHAGQLLATLEIPEMADDLARAKATIERSQAEVTRARDELRRAQSVRDGLEGPGDPLDRFNAWFNPKFESFLNGYDWVIARVLKRPVAVLFLLGCLIVVSLFLFPLLDYSFFPRTDPGQFMMNVKFPSGTRIGRTDEGIARIEELIRKTVPSDDLGMIVSHIGSTPDFSAIYTSNSGMHSATVQVSLKEGHKVGSYEYMARVRKRMSTMWRTA